MLNFSKNIPMRYLAIAVFFLVLTSCNAPRAVYDYDETVRFTEIDTYQIFPDLVTGVNQLDEQRLLSIFEEEMADKGLSKSEDPDIYLNFYATEYETANQNNLGIGLGGTGRNVGVGVSGGIPLGGPDSNLQLTIDFIDVEKDALIWQAIVESRYDKDASPEKKEEQLRAMVEKALKGYPPGD